MHRKHGALLGLVLFATHITVLADSMPRVAVLDFKIPPNGVTLGPGFEDVAWGPERAQGFSAALCTVLANTGKFVVVERTQLSSVNNERVFGQLTSGIGFGSGGFGGADYCVLGEVTLFDAKRVETPIPYSDQYRVQYFGSEAVNIRMVSLQSGKVLSARKVSVELVKDNVSGSNGFIEELLSATAKKAVNAILEGAYPAKISSISGDAVYINKGEDGDFKPGSRFLVYAVGEAILDPDTKKKIGNTEAQVGEIEIIEVLPGTSKARIVDSSGGAMAVGMVCRMSSFEPVRPSAPLTPGSSDAPIKW
jgi:curli biogenesis system outer membrane secretion channel CsgG